MVIYSVYIRCWRTLCMCVGATCKNFCATFQLCPNMEKQATALPILRVLCESSVNTLHSTFQLAR